MEDDRTMRRALSLILKAADYDTVRCGSGRRATTLLERGRYDLLLTDLFIPAPDGLDLFKRWSGELPVLILTGYLQSPRAVLARNTAGDAFMEKPFSAQTLRETVAALLNRGADRRMGCTEDEAGDSHGNHRENRIKSKQRRDR